MSFGAAPTLMGMKRTYKGSCHCGAVRFEADLDLSEGTTRCNCSFCSKARTWFAIAKGDTFRLTAGADALSDYQRTLPGQKEPLLHFQFCKHCGVRAFTKGGYLAQFGDSFHAVMIACLDGIPDEELVEIPIQYNDGRNDRFGQAPAVHEYL